MVCLTATLAVSYGTLVGVAVDKDGKTCYRSRVIAQPMKVYAWGKPHGETRAQVAMDDYKARSKARMHRAFSIAIDNGMAYDDIVDPSEPCMRAVWNELKRAKQVANILSV